MICSRCGATMSDDQIFCLECGHEIIYVPLYNVEEDLFNIGDLFSNDSEETTDSNDPCKSETTKENKESKEGKDNSLMQGISADVNLSKNNKSSSSSRKTLIFISIIGLLLIFGIVGYLIFTSYNFEYQYNKAVSAISNEDYELAEGYAKRAVELDPDNSDALVTLFSCLLGNKQNDEAYNVISRLNISELSFDTNESIIKSLIKAEDYSHLALLLSKINDEQLLLKYEQFFIQMPKLNYSGGNYFREIKLKLTVDTDADIYFSLDGSDPLKGNLYKGEITLKAGKYDLRAVAVNEYKVTSPEKKASFDINPKAPDMPVISASDKEIKKTTRIILECQKGCTMFYTWDGTTPTPNSTEYKGPIEIPEGNNIISVIAVDDYGQMSSVAKKNYILN